MQDAAVITIQDVWGNPASAGSVTVTTTQTETGSKGKTASHSPQTLQAGSGTGQWLYSTADLHAHPGNYK